MSSDPSLSRSAKPFVTVVIPVFGGAERLGDALTALETQTWPADRYEVIAVDNGARLDMDKLAAPHRRVRILSEATAGSYAARNRGIREARGEILAFMDADCVPEPCWIERGVAHLTHTAGCGLVGGRIELSFRDPNRPTAVELYERAAAFRQREYVERWHFAATANLFTSRAVIEDVGAFDGRLKSLGDMDWGWRVAAAGYRLVYAADATVPHPARRSLEAFKERSSRVAGGFYELAKTNGHGLRTLLRSAAIGLVPLRHFLGFGNQTEKLPLRDRMKIAAVLACLLAVRAIELARLSLGGTPSR